MSRHGRRNLETARVLSPDVAATRSASWLAVCHVSCWASSVILGAVSIWLRIQATEGVERSPFGIVGVGLWGSLPYAFAGAFSIRASKNKSYPAIRSFFVSSIISLLCSVSLFGFSSLVVAMEATIETIPKRIIVAAILAGFSLLEIVTSVLSCISCYTTIGCFDGKVRKGDRMKDSGLPRSSKIGPGDDESGHVTVMALPARQAAELFYTMYKPFFSNNGAPGFNLSEAAPTQEQFYHDTYENVQPTYEQRRRRHRHRSRHETHDYDTGFPPAPSPYPEPEYSDDELEYARHYHRSRRQGTPHRHFQEEDVSADETPPSSKLTKLATVTEDESDEKNKKTEPEEKPANKPIEPNLTKVQNAPKGKEAKQNKDGVKK